MQKQQDELLLQELLRAFPNMSTKDKVFVVEYSKVSAKENPKRIPDLTLISGRRSAA